MVDLAAITAGLSSLKAAGDITRSLMEVRDLAKFQGDLIELQRRIISAQQSAMTVQSEPATRGDYK